MFSSSEVPTRMFSRLQMRVAYTEKRGCTWKIKIKARENQATRKVSHFASRGRQTTLQARPQPQVVIDGKSRSATAGNYGDAGVHQTIIVASVLLFLMARILTGKCQHCIDKVHRTWSLKSQTPAFSSYLTWSTTQSLHFLFSEMEEKNKTK